MKTNIDELKQLYEELSETAKQTADEFTKFSNEMKVLASEITKEVTEFNGNKDININEVIGIKQNKDFGGENNINPIVQRILSLIKNVKDVDFKYEDMQYIRIGKRSLLAYDGHIYALIHRMDLGLINYSLNLDDLWQDYADVENNEDYH